jgi:hypothetical protein
MIITKNIVKKVTSGNLRLFKKDGFKIGDIVIVDVNNLSRNSHEIIFVKCDICGIEKNNSYRQYMDSYEKYNLYSCSPNCAQTKNKITNMEKYGVVNVFQSEIIKNKIIETNTERYNVSYPSQSKEIRDKSKKTLMMNYGVENPMFSDVIKSRVFNTCEERYGTKSYFSSNEMELIRINKGTKIPNELKDEYSIYQFEVRKLTDKTKKEIFENWNGYDYYDNEYIKYNLQYKYYDKKYPTMDHKISIYHGFINNLDPKIIASFENIVITKRSINSSKHTKSIF